MMPFPNHRDDQSQNRDRKERDDKIAFKPIFGLPAVEHHLKTCKSKGYQKNPETIDAKPAAFPGILHFPCELRRVRNKPLRQKQRHDPDGDVDKEDPPPAPVVGDPTAERRADYRRSHDGHAVEGESRGPLLWGERIHENGLLDRSEAAASDALQNPKEDQQAQ